ncbi:ubiquitin-conjugating enzyme/RWD-like protein [Jimgerdemannia flammicorona]|uniref:Ubiquitin-conjugating enzyme/RWD-like protein n=1 Tax=Jimgerdemannia flammicorona TaxID=994334 RepID=A0A433Q5A1_9FUNG|nr:ubiquitin-conjugating enzyme/RWD-like protein [Jimgerdemannia flammicorona]
MVCYHNEPGFEDQKEAKDIELIHAYNLKIQHETIRISVCDRLEHFLAIKRVPERVPEQSLLQRPFLSPSYHPKPYLPPAASTASKIKFSLPSSSAPFLASVTTTTTTTTTSASSSAVSTPTPTADTEPAVPAVDTPPASSADEPEPEIDALAATVVTATAIAAAVASTSAPVTVAPASISHILPGMTTASGFTQPRYATTHSIGPEFEDASKRLFLCYYENYVETVKAEKEKVADGTAFKKMPFEGMGNTMDGCFNYAALLSRLIRIQEALSAETRGWMSDSARWISEDTTTAANLKRQYEQAREHFRDVTDATVEVSLVDNNPFVWEVVVFGKPMTHYDGGLFRLQLLFSDRFPDVQPRARFLTPLYHPHVTESGVPWYRPARTDDVKTHIVALARLLDEDPSPDPLGHVNAAASRLCFGTREERKEYGRNARRCANRSVEYNV